MKSRHEFGSPEQWYDYLRTYFAGQALCGLMAVPDKGTHVSWNEAYQRAAEIAVGQAEQLLKTLQK